MISRTGRVFVVGAYVPNGGTYMAYHIGRILQLDFRLHVVAVTLAGEHAENNTFLYDVVFPSIPLEEMENLITDGDILIANPSFSSHLFGLRLPGRKLMYIQGFNTFALLDCHFDHYICVSGFVAKFVASTYGIRAPVISAFIAIERVPSALPWGARPAGSIVIHLKGDSSYQKGVLTRLRDAVSRGLPGVDLDNILDTPLPHTDFVARLGRARYLVSLSAAEGFGLVPLEAMAMGTTVIGFDGFGGREYMRSGKNCLVTSYPDIEGVAGRLVAALQAPRLAERLAKRGRLTASRFPYERFHAAWHDELRRFLQAEARCARLNHYWRPALRNQFSRRNH
jgi:hypothetical protein